MLLLTQGTGLDDNRVQYTNNYMALLKGAANAISAQQRAVTLDLYAKAVPVHAVYGILQYTQKGALAGIRNHTDAD
ncbi:TPA: hypothetical protein ACH3X2_010945 [Trebouxia sp. C0005]